MDDDLLLHSPSTNLRDVYNQSGVRGSGWLGGSGIQRTSASRTAHTIITWGHNYLHDNLLPVINNLQGINLCGSAHRNHCCPREENYDSGRSRPQVFVHHECVLIFTSTHIKCVLCRNSKALPNRKHVSFALHELGIN
jgi:hypothetical protein